MVLLVATAAWGAAASGGAGAPVAWEDVAGLSGVSFRLAGGMSGQDIQWPAFPEILGGGACWFDYDRDGYEDLFLVNQVYNAENPYVDEAWAEAADPHNQLYRNEGDGAFTDVSAEAGVDSRAWGYGCSAADFDGDGFLDLFVANFGDNELFRNRGDGTFANVSASSGLAMQGACGEYACQSTSSAWADYDGDGFLDLFVANYLETEPGDTARGPNTHVAQPNWLFRNRGDGTFSQVAAEAGVAGRATDADGSKSLGVVWLDADLDGRPDLYVANDLTPNELHLNQGDGTFADRSAASGLDDEGAGMGVAAGDYDGDGLPDLYFTHYQGEHNGFYRNRGDGTFEQRSGEDGLAGDFHFVGWGTAWADWDRDGDLDLMAANGHTEPLAVDDEGNAIYSQSTLVFRNDPADSGADPWDREWADVSDASGPGIAMARVSRGAAVADHDLDGDLDVAMVNNANQTAQLLRASGAGEGWLAIALEQPGPNRHAIGARVEVEAGGAVQVREVRAGSSFLSQDSLLADFGLGDAGRADRITVHWPGGGTTTVSDVPGDQVVRVVRSTGAVLNDTLSPVTSLFVEGPGQDGWHRGPVLVSLEATDRGVSFVSGVARTEAALGAAASLAPFDGTDIPVDAEGVHEIRYRSTDAMGNTEPLRRAHVRIDTTPPTPEHALDGVGSGSGWWVTDVEVTLGGADGLSGVGAIRYRLGGGSWQPYDGPFTLSEDGVHEVTYVVADVAGNAAPPSGFEVRLDQGPPEVALLAPAPGSVYVGGQRIAGSGEGPAVLLAPGAAFPVRAAASDAMSGMGRVSFQVDGEVVAVDHEGPDWTFAWDAGSLPPGLHELVAVASDRAGNMRSVSVDVLLVPAGAPGLPGAPVNP